MVRKLRKNATAADVELAVIGCRCILRIAILAEAHAMLLSLRKGRISQVILASDRGSQSVVLRFCSISYNIDRDPPGREEQIYASAHPERLLTQEYNLASTAVGTETAAAILPGVAGRLMRNIGRCPSGGRNP